jgi:uncharacterized protein YfdQ (DUF2303 family)
MTPQPLIDLQLVKDTALAAAEPKVLAETELVAFLVPDGGRLELVDLHEKLKRYATTPARAAGTHQAATVQAFIDITARHQSEALTVWVHPASGEIVAVLNDHGGEQAPGWGDHRVALKMIETDEWKRWKKLDGQLVKQEPFAEHIQEGLTEIAAPPAAELLEVVTTMQGNVGVSWQNGVSLRDGALQVKYVEQTDATAGRDGNLSIPTDFTLVMAPFIGEDVVQIDAKLRWRIRGGELTIGYKLDNPERIVREVLEKIADRLRDEFPGVVYLGSPSPAR